MALSFVTPKSRIELTEKLLSLQPTFGSEYANTSTVEGAH
jgi:hypothetical protein